MNEENLKNYYNKFNEDKRLKTRHGNLEFITTLEYIKKYVKPGSKIADIGAGCGAYSEELTKLGYEIEAVELVKHNVRVIEKKGIKAYHGNAINLKMFKDETFDAVLLFGPLYHLISEEEKIKAINEAKRIVKSNGIIFAAYVLNDYAIIRHGFMDKTILNEIEKINENFNIISYNNDLYSYMDLDLINDLNNKTNLKRIELISTTGLSNYLREYINKLSNEEYELYLKYHLSRCNKIEYIGYSSNIVDILKKD